MSNLNQVKYVFFWDLIDPPEFIQEFQSPNHVSVALQTGKFVQHFDPYLGNCSFSSFVAQSPHKIEYNEIVGPTNEKKQKLTRAYRVELKSSLRENLIGLKQSNAFYGRPMYCQNFVAYFLGLDVGQILTPKHFHAILRKKDNLTNYQLTEIFKEENFGVTTG